MPDDKTKKPAENPAVRPAVAPPKKPKVTPKKTAKDAGKRGRVTTKTGVETGALKRNLEKQRKVAAAEILKNLDEKKIITAIGNGKLSPELWDFKLKAGLKRAKNEWGFLGIAKKHSEFCNNNFKLLEKSPAKNKDAHSFALDFFDSIMGRILEIQRKIAAEKILKKLDKKKIATAIKDGKISPELWDFRSKAGLARVKKEWGLLGIIKENPKICRDIFKQLERASDPKFTTAVVFFTSIKNGVTTKVDLKLETQRKPNTKLMLKNLSEWKISIARRSGKVNPELWNFRSKANLDRIKKEWSYLGITTGNSTYYNTIFRQLEKSHDRQFLGTIAKPSAKYDSYTHPFQNLNDLETNTDPEFSLAVKFFASIKKMVTDQDTFQKATKEGLQKKNEDSIVSGATGIVSENFSAFKESIRTRDYSTAAIYLIGLYALWKTYKSLPKDKQDRYSKYLFWGTAAYCSNIFLKKAGIDIGKKLGFKDADAEVRGTPMAALARLDLEGLREEDYVTARDVNFINLSALHAKYKETNKPGGIRWVDPNQFPTAFGDRFKGMRSTDIMKSKGLSAKQKAYKAKGESLYRVVQSLEAAYNKTMHKETGKSFAAILSSGILAKSTVFDFVVALQRYAPEHRLEKSITAALKGTEKARDRLREVFKGSGMGFDLEKGRKAGHFDGQLMGFPVVYVRDSRNKQFLVFSRSDYDKAKKTPHVSAKLGTIPLIGSATGAVTALRKAIHAKVGNKDMGLLGRFVKNSKGLATFKNVRYDHAHGGWMAEVSYEKGKIIKGTGPIPMKVNIVIGDNGKSISLTRKTGGQLVYIKDVLDANAFYGNMALSQLVTQRATGGATDFSALHWFHINNKLSFHDNDPSDDKFRVKIANVPMAVWIRLNSKGQYEFMDSDVETKLLRNGLFKRALRESVGNNKELQGSIDNLRSMVRSTDESYFIHLVKNVPSWFSKATWHKVFRGVQLSHFTGSVAKNYTYALIEAQREKVLTDFEISLSGAKKLSDVGGYVNKTLPAAINDFRQLTKKLNKIRGKHTAEGSEFDADEYSETVLTGLMAVGCKSNDYKEWYKRFSTSLLVGNTPDDIRKSTKVKQLMKVFAYHTAPIDDQSIDGANLWAKKPAVIEKPEGLVEKPEEPKDPKDKEKPAYKAALKRYEDYQKALGLGAKLAAKKPAVVERSKLVKKPEVVERPTVIQRPEVVKKPTTVLQNPKALIKAFSKYEAYEKALEKYKDYLNALEEYKGYKNTLNKYEDYQVALGKYKDYLNALKEYEAYKKDLIAKSGLDKSKDYVKLLNGNEDYKKALVEYDITLKEWKKAQKYRKHAAYAQYVAEQIYLKMKIPGTTVYPAPSSSWWNIRSFARFDASRYATSHELVDTRPNWNLNKDYIGFDVYVEKLEKDEPVNEDLVILPRNIKVVTVELPSDPAKRAKAEAVLRKIMGGPIPTFDKLKKTDLEVQFYNLLQKAVMRLQSKYGSRVKAGSFQKFLASYRIAYQIDKKLGTHTYTFKMGHEIVPGRPQILFRRGSNMLGQMATLDTFLSNSGSTMTKTQQKNQLKAAVARVIQNKILNRGTFKTYFKGKGPLRWAEGVYVDFKDWLWGLRNK